MAMGNEENTKLLYPDLTFRLNGIAIQVRKEIGRFGREKNNIVIYLRQNFLMKNLVFCVK